MYNTATARGLDLLRPVTHTVWMRSALMIALALVGIATQARADRVYLVGGSMIEGEAVRDGDKVWVEIQAGRLAIPVTGVVRIEESETDLARVEQRLAKLKPDDIQGMLALARYCRDHDMRARERELLLKVLAALPDQPEARLRLGYVKNPDGLWISRDEQRRAKGLVPYGGRWITQTERLEIERREHEAKLAEIAREKAELELEATKLALAQKKLEAQRQAQTTLASSNDNGPVTSNVYLWPMVSPGTSCVGSTCIDPGFKGPKPFPIPGVRDPRDMIFSIPGAKDPRTY